MDSSRDRLPHPSSLTLPPPDVGFATMAHTPTNQQLPPPPAQWQSSDDAMHHWLRAKAEEDRRKQEEEKTRQETLRLEQRRVEQSMLRDSLMAGIPPHIIPLIFAGISQEGLPQPILELTQQYLAQISGTRGPNPPAPPPARPNSHSHSSSHSQRASMHTRQDSHSVPHSPYPPPAQNAVPPPPNILLSQNLPPNAATPHTPQQLKRTSIPSGPPDAQTAANRWMNAGVAQTQSAPINMGNVQYAPGSSLPSAQAPRRPNSQSRRSPPSLYFHHWVPPAQPPSSVAPGKGPQESPATSSNSRRSEYQNSPGRKRKAPGPHRPAPVPSSRSSESLPGIPQLSQPGSPGGDEQQEGRSRYHRHPNDDTPASQGDRPLQYVEVENAERINHTRIDPVTTAPSQLASASHTSPNSAGQARSGDWLPPEQTGESSPRALRAPDASSPETGPRDSDIETSSQHSHTSGTALVPTQHSGASR
ncbi:uncharacterized protein BJX67DRAFT_239792 [Aspergillus lucknowensis]|uniref:Uncharacterized protein n=1 Tax=Aspergillus lucknowensis TaxID=176173 RepID=A0ABR4LGE9_9EURO